MTDFLLSVLWTVLIASITVFADAIAHRLIFFQDCIAAIRDAMQSPGTTDTAKRNQAITALDNLRVQLAAFAGWGSDLVAVALSLDIACLGLTITNRMQLSFFERLNSGGAERTLQMWLLVLAAHFLCLLISIACRHKHAATINAVRPQQLAWIFQVNWFRQNIWSIISRSLGFFSLLSAFAIVNDAVRW